MSKKFTSGDKTKAVRQRIAMKAVIIKNGKVLLLREAGQSYSEGTNEGKWGLPGGRLDIGESWQAGLFREIKEETGLEDIKVIKPLSVSEWTPVIKGEPTQIVAVFFRCEWSQGDITLSDEHDDYKWITESDLTSMNIMLEEMEALQEYFGVTNE